GAAGACRGVRGCGATRRDTCTSRWSRAALPGMLELRSVRQLRRARCRVSFPRGPAVTAQGVRHPGELRWETRLLAVLTLILVSLGIAVCYAAGSYREDWYAEAQQQLSGAVIGGLLYLVVAGIDYRLLRKWARPMFYATI